MDDLLEVKMDFSQFDKFLEKLSRFSSTGVDKVFRETAEDAQNRLIREIKRRTGVGVPPDWIDDETRMKYWGGYTGGSLRDSWRLQGVVKKGNTYTSGAVTNLKYAPYYEFGHRQRPGRYVPAINRRLKVGWVPGNFPARNALAEVKKILPKIMAMKLNNELRRVMK